MRCCKIVVVWLAVILLASSVFPAPAIDPVADVTIPAGRSLILPVTATSPAGRPLTFTVLSSTAGIVPVLHTNNPFWKLSAVQVADPSAPGAFQTPFRGGTATVTNVGDMTFMLFPEYAPHTVNVFQGLTYSGFFSSNTIFHRVITNFVIQGGDPMTNGSGGPVFRYNDEFNPQAIFSGNGQLALANSGKNTDGSQFFVTVGQRRYLDFGYVIFGQLVRGFDVLTNINLTPTDTNSRPLADVIIQQASYVTDSTDAVLTLIATNVAGLNGTITIVADDGIGGRSTNTFGASVIADTDGNSQPFFLPDAVTNLVGPANVTLTNRINAYELGGAELYWDPQFLDQASYNAASRSSFSNTNSLLKSLTYNVTNIGGQFALFLVPTQGFVGPVNLQLSMSSSSELSLYDQYGVTPPTYEVLDCTFVFGDTPIVGQARNETGLAGVPLASTLLATFTNGIPNSAATNFTAFINWGDNSTNSGTISSGAGGQKAVVGSHTYAYPGIYPVYTTVQSAIGASATILSFVDVTNQGTTASNLLTVQVTGQGTVSPNYNNASLTVGNAYSINATPADKWILTSWTDENGFILGTGTNLTFTMSPGLSLSANFALATNPSLTISSPAPGQVITNLYSTPVKVTGTAFNNGIVTAVWYQVNQGGWLQATGTTNWTVSFNPQYGVSNVFQAYAVNNFGYVSTTNRLQVKYLAGDVLTVTNNGPGSVTPDLNGKLLPLGSNYVLTAAATNSIFAFASWSGSLSSASATLSFRMASNLSLTANYLTKTRPTVAITNLTTGQRVSNSVFTVQGKAAASWPLSAVEYQFNGGGWNNAGTTTNWAVALNLLPGTNVFQVYSVDSSGNTSLTNTTTVYYVLSAQLTLATTGLGTITPNYSNAWLEVGKNYTATAVPATGFAFTNWTGSYATNQAALQLTMASNLTFTANFADITKPTIAVTNLTSGQRTSNSVFVVRGTASDNWRLSGVQYHLNAGGWNTADGVSNWSGTLNLLPGTNTLQAYAYDTTGNKSLTNTTMVYYVLSAQLTLATTGLGSITPNYSNAWLEVGKNYTATAVPATGFAFTNWTGNYATNQAALQFTMASNLTFTANFADITKPTILITNLTAGQRTSNSVFVVRGTASDNWRLGGVQYQLNAGGWNTADGVSNWSGTLNLLPGTNTLQAYAYDTTGNKSLTNTTTVYYVLSAQLTLATTGLGSITPNYSNAWLEVGKNYTATAVPASGFAFTNWTGSYATNQAALQFTMASNLTFTANFADITKPTILITNLTAGQRTSNSVFVVRGTASDNWRLGGVEYQLNGGGWNVADGVSNWSGTLNLLPGTNTLQAYAYDTTGNKSLTNTTTVYYVLSAQLTLATIGLGSITPNYSNAWLEVGKNYTVTAVPATGWYFYNWVDGGYHTLTNRATLTFMMGSNLALTAGFYQPPAIKVQPVDTVAFYASIASFSVLATGSGPFTYQWQYNSANLTGQNASTLELSSLTTNNAGAYRVMVSSFYGSVTSSVAKLVLTNAPTSLAGYDTVVTPDGGNPFQVSFGTNTFSQFSQDTNNSNSGVGNYAYQPTDALNGQLSLQYLAPPDIASNGVQVVDVTFVSPGWLVFTNDSGPDTGVIQYFAATNFVPATWSGHKIVLTSASNTITASLSAGTFSAVVASDKSTAGGPYTAAAYSRVAGWLQLHDTESGNTYYLNLRFQSTTAGIYVLEAYDQYGNFGDEQQGTFKWQ